MNVEYVTIYPDGYETSETVTAEQAVSLAIEHDAECVFDLDEPYRYRGVPTSITMRARNVQAPHRTAQVKWGIGGPSVDLCPIGEYTLKKVICTDRTKGLPLTGLYHDREQNVIWYDKPHDYYAWIADKNCDYMVGINYKPKPPFTPLMNAADIKNIRKETA